MADVFPRRNLPGDAEQWGREVEKRVAAVDSTLESVQQSVQGQNRNTASSLSVIAAQIEKIEQTQAQIQAAQADIIAAQAEIVATSNFLATQTVSDSRVTETTYSGTPGGTVWLPYDGTYDCALDVTTGSAGKLLIQASANLMAGGGVNCLMAIEVVGQVAPAVPSPFTSYVTDSVAGVTRVAVAGLVANTTYTVRIRRGVSGTTGGAAIWGVQTLTVTRS